MGNLHYILWAYPLLAIYIEHWAAQPRRPHKPPPYCQPENHSLPIFTTFNKGPTFNGKLKANPGNLHTLRPCSTSPLASLCNPQFQPVTNICNGQLSTASHFERKQFSRTMLFESITGNRYQLN